MKLVSSYAPQSNLTGRVFMHRVAHHLQVHAVSAASNERDAYARSAFNRYYYDLFLLVRSMLIFLDSEKYSSLSHSDYPNVLKKIAKYFQKEKEQARRSGDVPLETMLQLAISASKALASLMEKAYSVRIVADYNPEESVNFVSDKRFSLKKIEITDAHNWRTDVETWIRNIKQAWRQINV
ncbi:MAG: hypothetical protein IT559_03160 [Alphaproteobacteria bacterium]|nr:hypothetical protein [Alphaproteobacteria bacterium]